MQTLKQEAVTILDDLALLAFLSDYGRAKLVGSVALDLIVKLDIDIHLLLNHSDLFPVVNQLLQYLLDQPKVREVRITDWRSEGGIKVGIDAYPGTSGSWSLDIWVTDKLETTAFELVPQLQERLTPQNRQIILELKQYYYQQSKLRDGLSLKIYRAVLDGGVRTVDEFERWLSGQE